MDPTLVFVGTYTGPKSQGIYRFRLQPEPSRVSQNVALTPLGLAAASSNPSFLELDPRRRLLFAVNEVSRFEGSATGAVSAFAIDRSNGVLTPINQRASMGTAPCHLVLDKSGRHLLVANYGSGSVAVLPVAPGGRLGAASQVVQHTGSSVNPERQKGPHAHCVTIDRANRYVFVCDLGLDKVLAYRFDAERGTLTPHDPPFAQLKPGAGPRHMVFRPDGRFAFVVNEMHSTVTAFRYDADAGRLHEVQTISTLPEHFDGANSGAEIDVHASGKWLYASNRGHNSVVLFGIDTDRGTLTYVEEQGTGGFKPRHFGIDPSATYLAVGNQDSDTILVARLDAGSGRLKPSGVLAYAPSPVCMKFLPPSEQPK
ncbi:MAG TPA: lactonase family protein [Vicinamibacterales bacterium]|nr:lactonase family protein [Vicinamibacterales bacterium]